MSLTKLNMISYLFYVPLLLMSFLGAVFIVLKVDNHYLINKIRFDETRILGWSAISYTMLMLPIGIILSQKMFSIKDLNTSLIEYSKKPIRNLFGKYEIILKSLLFLLSALGFIIMLYTFYSIGSIPILSLLKGNHEELARLRIIASREFGGNIYLRNIFAIQLLPALTFIALAYLYKSKTLFNYFWFAMTLVATILILTYDLSKSPLAMFFSGFIFFLVWVKGQISLVKFSVISLLFIVLITLFYIGFGNSDLGNILLSFNEGASGRVLFSQVAGTFFAIEYFDTFKDFIGFNSLSRLLENIGVEYTDRAGRLIMEIINPKGIREGTAGVQNTLFIGEAWANFGVLGLLISPLYIGFLIGALFYSFLKLPKSPIFIGLYVFLSYKTALIGGFNDYIYNIAYLSVFLIFTSLIIYTRAVIQKLEQI